MKVSNQHSLLQRIVRAAEIDTVIDTRMIVNSLAAPARDAHENNVIGTMNILAACTGADSPVRRFVFKSSTHYYGAEQDDPAFFTERDAPPAPAAHHASSATSSRPRRRSPTSPTSTPRSTVTVLRCANVLGPDVETGVHADVLAAAGADDPRLRPAAAVRARGRRRARARARRAARPVPGTYNVAADGVLALSEAISLLGTRAAAGAAARSAPACCAAPLRRLGFRIPDEMANLLRFGRGVDNRLYKATGFRLRLHVARGGDPARRAPAPRADPARPRRRGGLHYEREVEEFLRWSPHVQARAGERRAPAPIASRSASEATLADATKRVTDRQRALRTLSVPLARKLQIAVVFLVAVLLLAAVGAYAWDSSKSDQIADGVTIGGVDVGGMTADEATAGGRRGARRAAATRR